jgi:hypothetical protein
VPTDIDFSSTHGIERWLAVKRSTVGTVLATRVALRVAPLLAGFLDPVSGGTSQLGGEILLPAFRALAASWGAGTRPAAAATHVTALTAAAAAVRTSAGAIARAIARAAYAPEDTRVAHAAAGAAAEACAEACADAGRLGTGPGTLAAADAAVTYVPAGTLSAHADAARAALAAAAEADAWIMEDEANASALAARPLWLTKVPAWASDAWRRLETALLKENQDWRVWTDWYRARLEGRPTNEALEIARMLIAEEIWQQGPRAVNAEIVRLIAQHEGLPGVSTQNEPRRKTEPPEVPDQRPAAIEPVWQRDLLTLPAQPVTQDLTEAEFIAALAAVRDDLYEFADDLSGEANIDRRFLAYVRRFAGRVPQAPPTQDELFRLGHIQEVVLGYAQIVQSEWPAFLSVRYHQLMLQSERVMRQSPLWRDFKRNAEKMALSEEQVAAAAPLAVTAATALQEGEAREFVDAPVSAALQQLMQTLQQVWRHDETSLEAIEAGNALLAADLIESVNNVLKPIAEAAIDYAVGFSKALRKAAKRQGPKDGGKVFMWLLRLALAGAAREAATGSGAFAELHQLIAKFPQAFKWLESVLHFIWATTA